MVDSNAKLFITQDLLQFPLMPSDVVICNIFVLTCLLVIYKHLCSLNRRRQWHPTPVLLPGKSHGQRSQVGCSPWGREESDTTERLPFHFHALEKETATHSSILAWRIPGTGEPGGLPSIGSDRVRHDWSDLAAAAAAYSLTKKNARALA